MGAYYDNGGKMHYLHDVWAEVEVGTKVFIHNTPRWGDESYSPVTEVTRTSNLSFWVRSPYDSNKEIRFKKADGNQAGERWYTEAILATERNVKMVAKFHRKAKALKALKKDKATKQEQALRERYNCDDISDEEVQKILKQIRNIAEGGRDKIENFVSVASAATVEKPWELARNLDERDISDFRIGVELRDRATDLHDTLCDYVRKMGRGISFEESRNLGAFLAVPGDKSAHSENVCRLLKLAIEIEADRTVSRLLEGYNSDFMLGYREFAKELKDVFGSRYSYQSIKERNIKTEEDAA